MDTEQESMQELTAEAQALAEDEADLVSMRDTALDILRAIWNWDYVTWESIEPMVTGPIATLLRNNMAESEEASARLLRDLSITESGRLEDKAAWVRAVYTWQEREAAEGESEGSETMVWIFLHEDGRWKACSVGRTVPGEKA